MITRIRKLLKQNPKMAKAVNTIGLALLAGPAAVELALQRSKIVFGKFKIIASRNKIASGVISLILFMGIVIGGLALAGGNDDYPPLDNEVGAVGEGPTQLAYTITVSPPESQEAYLPPPTDVEEPRPTGVEVAEEPEPIEMEVEEDEIIPEQPITEEPDPDDDEEDLTNGENGDDNNQDDDVEPPPPPPRQCVWVRVYTQQTFDRGSYQERTIISGQQELWIIEDGWAIGRRFYSLDEVSEFLTSEENLAAADPATGFSIHFENIFETVTVWVPNIVTENVFNHERCNDCGAVR